MSQVQQRQRTGPKKSTRTKREQSTWHSKRASATKGGPGRYHADGHHKDSPIKSKGAPRGFVLHTASPARRKRRELVKHFGIRQVKRKGTSLVLPEAGK